MAMHATVSIYTKHAATIAATPIVLVEGRRGSGIDSYGVPVLAAGLLPPLQVPPLFLLLVTRIHPQLLGLNLKLLSLKVR